MMKDGSLALEDVGVSLDRGRREAFNEFNEMVYWGKIQVEPVNRCLCGLSDFEGLSRYDRFGLPFGTQICRSCGLITQTLRIKPESLSLFYERIYWPLIMGDAPTYATKIGFDNTPALIAKHLPSSDFQEITIFEVGCGAGGRIERVGELLARLGCETTLVGCDYSDDALVIAASKGIRTVRGGMDELLQAGQADVLILSHVFEHFPDLDEATDQINRLVHDDSLIYIEVPGVVDLENKTEYLCDYQVYNVLAHTFNFSLTTLSQVMARKGFALVEGDEYIRAIFTKGITSTPSKSGYEEIMTALERASVKRMRIRRCRDNPLVRYARNVVKSLLGRAVN